MKPINSKRFLTHPTDIYEVIYNKYTTIYYCSAQVLQISTITSCIFVVLKVWNSYLQFAKLTKVNKFITQAIYTSTAHPEFPDYKNLTPSKSHISNTSKSSVLNS